LDGVVQDHGDGFELLYEFSSPNGWANEMVNALLELYLRHYVSANQHDWAKLLDISQFSYNMQWGEATEKSPFELIKKWADERRRHVEFKVRDQVMVKLLPQQFKSLRKVHKGL
nr:hypothetical protein CTI12_AA187700 [Tanacetum cinerariifolium]